MSAWFDVTVLLERRDCDNIVYSLVGHHAEAEPSENVGAGIQFFSPCNIKSPYAIWGGGGEMGSTSSPLATLA